MNNITTKAVILVALIFNEAIYTNAAEYKIPVRVSIEDDWLVRRNVIQRADARVRKQRMLVVIRSVCFVDVTERMNPGLDLLDASPQILTPDSITFLRAVQNTHRRSVRDQKVRVRRNVVPDGSDLFTAYGIERPVMEPRLPWRPVELDPEADDRRVLQVDRVRVIQQTLSDVQRIRLEHEVVVPGDHDLVNVRLLIEPSEEFLDLARSPAPGCVAAVNQDVSTRQANLVMPVVRVADHDYSRRHLLPFISSFTHSGLSFGILRSLMSSSLHLPQ